MGGGEREKEEERKECERRGKGNGNGRGKGEDKISSAERSDVLSEYGRTSAVDEKPAVSLKTRRLSASETRMRRNSSPRESPAES